MEPRCSSVTGGHVLLYPRRLQLFPLLSPLPSGPALSGELRSMEINTKRLTRSVNITGENRVPVTKGGKQQHLESRRLPATTCRRQSRLQEQGERKQGAESQLHNRAYVPFPDLPLD